MAGRCLSIESHGDNLTPLEYLYSNRIPAFHPPLFTLGIEPLYRTAIYYPQSTHILPEHKNELQCQTQTRHNPKMTTWKLTTASEPVTPLPHPTPSPTPSSPPCQTNPPPQNQKWPPPKPKPATSTSRPHTRPTPPATARSRMTSPSRASSTART